MDENKAMPIPPKNSLFGEGDLSVKVAEAPQSDFVMSFANDAGDKAVVLTSVEVVGPDTIERHGRVELEDYAKRLMETGEDPFDLQIGNVYEGENAAADAEAEALRLDEEYNPGDAADDEALIEAVDGLHAAGGAGPVGEESDVPPLEAPPLEEPPAEPEEMEEPVEEEEIDVEEEPVFDQLRKAKKRL